MSHTDVDDLAVQARVRKLLAWGASLIALTAYAITLWNTTTRDVSDLKATTTQHAAQIEVVTVSVSQLRGDVADMRAQLAADVKVRDSQMELLKYIARGRNGPLPESAK